MRTISPEEKLSLSKIIQAVADSMVLAGLNDAASRVRRCDTGNLACVIRAVRVADAATRLKYGSTLSPMCAAAVENISLANAAATAILTNPSQQADWLEQLVKRATTRGRSESCR